MNHLCLLRVFLCVVLVCVSSGCEPITKKASNDNEPHEHGGHTHEHGEHSHEHGNHSVDSNKDAWHVHGVNGGHVFKFEPGEFTGEWLQSRNSDLIRLYILDANSKKNNPVNADSVIVKHGGSLFSLDPENTDDASSLFSLDDQKLAIAMNLGVTVELKIGDQTYIGKIEPSKAHQH